MLPELMFFLLKKGAHREAQRLTTVEIAEALDISQQSASRKLISLERDGRVVRDGGKVMLSQKALDELRKCAADVLESLSSFTLDFKGKVVGGLGEGAYYISQEGYQGQFEGKLGFKPFPGTLNLSINEGEIEKRLVLRQKKGIDISSFRKGTRTFGAISAYRCSVDGLPGAIIFPERSHHGLQVLEIISPVNLREKLSLSDGSEVRVEAVE